MGLNHLFAKKKLSFFFRNKQSETSSITPSSITPSDQKPREAKNTPYTCPSYATVLRTKGSFMNKSDLGITDANKSFCQILLEKEQMVPQDFLFCDNIFNKICRKIQNKNKARVVQDITRLIFFFAKTLVTYNAIYLDPLIENVNKNWNNAEPFYNPRLQPDYSIGFGRSAFTNNQLKKLKLFISKVPDIFISYFMAT
jgi:hypothetical protein